MSKQKTLIVAVILIAIILMAIGYAGLSATNLTIDATANASASADNFKVYFTGETKGAVDNIDVTATEGSVSATVNFKEELGLDTMGESASVILEIENGSEGINAESVNVLTDGTDTDIFDFTTVMCTEDGTTISDYGVDAGAKTYVKVTVSLKTSPTADVSATTTITLEAKPEANVTDANA